MLHQKRETNFIARTVETHRRLIFYALLLRRLKPKPSNMWPGDKPTVHPRCFLVSLPVGGGRCGGVLRWVRLHLSPVVPVAWAEAEAERPSGAGGAAGLLGALAGRQARLVQALWAVLDLQAPQTGLILPFRPQRARLSGVNCGNICCEKLKNMLYRGAMFIRTCPPCLPPRPRAFPFNGLLWLFIDASRLNMQHASCDM